MRQYILTDRDFEEFYALIEKIETENKLKEGDGPASKKTAGFVLDELRRTYRYHFVSWRNKVTTGDTYFRGPEPPRDDTVRAIKAEIERLSKLLPKTEASS